MAFIMHKGIHFVFAIVRN